jgi:maltose/moltooligosaccharide transporter
MENYLGNDRLLAVQIGGILLISAGVVCAFVVRENKTPNLV